jgi:integrase
MGRGYRRKCKCCLKLFRPDPRVAGSAIRIDEGRDCETGLPGKCNSHGLRKAMLRRLAEAGATEKQIAAWSGHETLREIERYTQAADQKRLAQDAMKKR